MHTRNRLAWLVGLPIVLLLSAGCATAPTPTGLLSTVAPTNAATPSPATPMPPITSASSPVPTAPSLPASTKPASVTVTDGANRTVTITGSPQRIVSLAPSTTEIAFALGLGSRVVAVDKLSDYPSQVSGLARISVFPVNYEQVVSFKPDLVLAASIQGPDEIKKLDDLKLTMLVVGAPTATFDNVMSDIALVGKATGTDAMAKTVTDAMKARSDAVKAKVAGVQSKPRVFWELDATDPSKPFTAGPGSFIADMIALAGGINVAAGATSAYPQFSAEEILAANPDVLILSDSCSFFVNPGCTPIETVKTRKGWAAISAVKNGKVLAIDDNLVSRPGPRIVDGLEAAAKLIHPELFK
jgi:iron complex transport system substrate-binding protein